MRKATDIRVVRTQNALLEALEELIKTKKLSCISITELCSKAGINRNTFYYHYNNIYELLDENKQIMIDELNEILTNNKTSNKEMKKLASSLLTMQGFCNKLEIIPL